MTGRPTIPGHFIVLDAHSRRHKAPGHCLQADNAPSIPTPLSTWSACRRWRIIAMHAHFQQLVFTNSRHVAIIRYVACPISPVIVGISTLVKYLRRHYKRRGRISDVRWSEMMRRRNSCGARDIALSGSPTRVTAPLRHFNVIETM